MKDKKKTNKLCEKCMNQCKQSASVKMLGCSKYVPGYVQVPLPFKLPKVGKKK